DHVHLNQPAKRHLGRVPQWTPRHLQAWERAGQGVKRRLQLEPGDCSSEAGVCASTERQVPRAGSPKVEPICASVYGTITICAQSARQHITPGGDPKV